MSSHTEDDLPKAISEGIMHSSLQGARILGVSVDDDPAKILTRLDEFVYRWQANQRPDKTVLDPDDAPFALGSLWGNQIVRKFNWEWRFITFAEHNNAKAPGVISPKRSFAIYPIHFLMGCLADPKVDCTILLSYNMLDDGKIEETDPGQYLNLMEGVKRIVPRIDPRDAFEPVKAKKSSWWNRLRGN